ncbi:hypothetical protein FGG08_005423 [Glutinoglossum americanum]|uniref:Threonylcarbamoyl-AMP synthase n=1 Tax=Glutinoglossum americanum TaxID=1670608 RepID=A0A9P8L1U5_9PEZI|nr:hypothetical protein FGG08_005423 [Glutinoglossum americanum]
MAHGNVTSTRRNALTKDQPLSGTSASAKVGIEYSAIDNEDTSKPGREMAYGMRKQTLRDWLSIEEIPAIWKSKPINTRGPNAATNGHSKAPGHGSELCEIQRNPPWALQPPRSAIILPIDPSDIGHMIFHGTDEHQLPQDWEFEIRDDTASAFYMREAAHRLQTSSVPIAFPTETVYGLGADATRSEAVQGIYKAKQRPSDNPLIVHICSLTQLRKLLLPEYEFNSIAGTGTNHGILNRSLPQELDSYITYKSSLLNPHDPIPEIYKPLIRKFWPGPLTIILPTPKNSRLAPEVTAGLSTFGARMPKSFLALALIHMAGVPLAAPSANASTKPSTTTAEHVKHDLEGRIDLILDGGPCDVGVESTVVDGLSNPPAILRPGGISIEQLQACPGWEDVLIGYKDTSEEGSKPKAPGMKYKHYSPRARVILHEADSDPPNLSEIRGSIGVVRTRKWPVALGLDIDKSTTPTTKTTVEGGFTTHCESLPPALSPSLITPPRTRSNGPPPHRANGEAHTIPTMQMNAVRPGRAPSTYCTAITYSTPEDRVTIWDIALGSKTEDIARGLFAALRELDSKGVDNIFIEGIKDEGDIAAAVMNRLRKAAEVKIK